MSVKNLIYQENKDFAGTIETVVIITSLFPGGQET